MSQNDNAVVEVAKERQEKDNDIHTLSTGVRVRLKGISASLISQVQSKFLYPDPPTVFVESKGREEPNPDDPAYKRACDEVDNKRGMAAMDAFIMFGVELVDGLPDDDGWVRKLELLGVEFDASDETVKEFNYKKHIAVGAPDLPTIQQGSINPARIRQAEASFRNNSKRE